MKIGLVIYFFFFLKASGQIRPPERDLDEFKFNGKLKSMQLNEFIAVDSFGLLKKTKTRASIHVIMDENNFPIELNGFERDENFLWKSKKSKESCEIIITGGKNVEKNNWKYDLFGNILEYSEFENDTLMQKEIATYDIKKKLLEHKEYNRNGKLSSSLTFKYDIKGNKIEELHFTANDYYNHEKFNYNPANQLIESFSLDKNDNTKSKTIYKYDKMGNVSEEIVNYITLEDSKFNSKKVYQYNNKNKIIAEIFFNSKGKEEKRNSFKYDLKGRLIEEKTWRTCYYNYDSLGNLVEEVQIVFNKNQNIIYKYLTKYEFDSYGNWIKKINSDTKASDIIPENYTITERLITYK